MTLFQDKLDAMVWSYSRVKSYFECPRMFYLTYLNESTQMESAFAQWGSLCHELLDRYAKGDLLAFELGDEYDRLYPEKMTERFPWNLWRDLDALYYDSGKAYFDSFEGFPENWEIIGSEIEIHVTIRGREVRGFIDLLVRDRNDGRLIVVDHKSKSRFKSNQELELYGFQPYLYAEWVFRSYSEYPKELVFNLFRAGTWITIPFAVEGMEKACDWLEETIGRIYEDEDFPDRVEVRCCQRGEPILEETMSNFFCQCLCCVRHRCVRSGLCIDGGTM